MLCKSVTQRHKNHQEIVNEKGENQIHYKFQNIHTCGHFRESVWDLESLNEES